MRIIIVDDSRIIQDRLYEMISEETDFRVIGQAYNVVKGKDMVSKLKPDVVISDIRMPGGGGIELLTYIKANFPQVKVIIATNYAYPQYREKCIEEGAEYFLSKAEDLDKIILTLRSIERNGGIS